MAKEIDKGSYRLQHLLYQTRPGFWVTAVLFIPKALPSQSKTGAVVFVSGHTPDAFRSNATSDDDYQIVQLNLVARGFVVLSFDPIGQVCSSKLAAKVAADMLSLILLTL